MPDPTRWWKDLSTRLGRDDMLDDPRFATPEALARNRQALMTELGVGFARFTLEELRERLGHQIPWEPVQNLLEVPNDAQVMANGYFADIVQPAGDTVSLVRAPVQFDEEIGVLHPAPGLGRDTDEILAQLGYDDARMAGLRHDGTVA
jgi:crotonobetainyl-CoA:carnitine CoA-transferase CaiB-like acyl-CoA transferase